MMIQSHLHHPHHQEANQVKEIKIRKMNPQKDHLNIWNRS